VSLILSTPTGSPIFQAHWLGQLPISLGKSNSTRSGNTQRDGNRHVRWELLRRRSEGSGGIYSKMSPEWRPTASETGRHWGRNTPEERAAEAVADHQGPCSESRGQPSAKDDDSQSQRVEERPVEHDARIPRCRRPIVVEDDQTGDVSSYSVSPWSPQGESLSQTLRKPKPLPTIWRLSFSPWPNLRSQQLLRLLTWRWGLTSWSCQRTQVNQPWGSSVSHQGSHGQQGPGLERYPEQGPEAPSNLAVSLLVLIINAILLTHHFPSVWKHARVICILKTGKGPGLPSSYRPLFFWIRLVKYSKRSY